MKSFTVTKPGGTEDFEFQAYTRLLEQIGIDVANVPRIPEPGTNRRWLYVWDRREEAEGFARELQLRTRDRSWRVYAFDSEMDSFGPVAPLDILESPEEDLVVTYYLAPRSRERVIRAFPHTVVYPVTMSQETLQDIKAQHGDTWWDELCIVVTGLSLEKVLSLGGYRIIAPSGAISHESLPQIPTAN